jgi:hypothetical protein
MTFTEAAIEVLKREGKPLHFKKIAELAIRENLLDHVGKIPEDVMGGQLAAHCRLPHLDRKVMPVQSGTFALVEWGLDEDPAGLEGIAEPPAEDDQPYRPRERHPIPSREMARSVGRGDGDRRSRRGREDGEERRSRRFPPASEVTFEILAGAGRPMTLAEIAAVGAERFLMPDAFVRDSVSLQAALTDDNRRRESAARKPLFAIEGDLVTLVGQPEPGERPSAQPRTAGSGAVADLRRSALATLRRRIRDCDGPTVEHLAVQMLERSGFRDLKVSRRGREHVIYVGRKRMGAGEIRYCARILRHSSEVGRREITECRRDLGHYGAQIGMVIAPGDASRDARGEASAGGQLPIVLLTGEWMAEAMSDAGVGVTVVAIPEVDERYFRAAAETAGQEEAARRARREERDRREREHGDRDRDRDRDRGDRRDSAPKDGQEGSAPASLEAQAEGSEGIPLPATAESGEGPDEGNDEGEGPEESSEPRAAGEGGEQRRRRRRRRRGRGRGRGGRPDGAASAAPGANAGPTGNGEPAAAPSSEPPRAASSGDEGGGT